MPGLGEFCGYCLKNHTRESRLTNDQVTNKFKVLATAMLRGTPCRFCYTSCSYVRGSRGTGSFAYYTL